MTMPPTTGRSKQFGGSGLSAECLSRRPALAISSTGTGAFNEALGDYVFSLDDDAYFSSSDTVTTTIKWFESDDRIGAVAIPYIEPLNRRSLSSIVEPFSEPAGRDLRSYVGCAHAVRRSVALELGGYPEFFVHQREERELCLRMRAAGWRVVYGDGGPIVHMVSPNREHDRITFYGGRNQILYETLNAPFPDVLLRVIRTSVGLVRYRFSWGDLPLRIRAILSGLRDTSRFWRYRRPVQRDFYLEHRSLPAHGAMHWENEIPPPCNESGSASER